jgi:hypothetical protein
VQFNVIAVPVTANEVKEVLSVLLPGWSSSYILPTSVSLPSV